MDDMKALQLEKIGALKMKRMPLPEPGHGEVRLRVTHCAVCRTDAKMWARGQRDLVLPRILGHEICGLLPEDGGRFVVWPGIACGQCDLCRSGAENLCREMRIMGFHRDGGFAEYVAVPESALIPVPDDLPGEVACLAEPVACVLNALQQAGVRAGHRVLIYGAGPMGLMAGMAARAWGAVPFVKEISTGRLAQRREFLDRTGIGRAGESEDGFDAAINAAPASDTFSDGLPRLRPGGCFCLFSGLTDDGTVPASLLNAVHYGQLRVTGAYGCTYAQMAQAVDLLRDCREVAARLIQGCISLEGVSRVLPEILAGGALKSVVSFIS